MSICIPRSTYAYHLSQISTRFSAIAFYHAVVDSIFFCTVSLSLSRSRSRSSFFSLLARVCVRLFFSLFASLFVVHIYLSIKRTLHNSFFFLSFFGHRIFLFHTRASKGDGDTGIFGGLPRGSFRAIRATSSQIIIEQREI